MEESNNETNGNLGDILDFKVPGNKPGNNKQPKSDHLKPYQWQKGVSGNPNGRPKAKPFTAPLGHMLSIEAPAEMVSKFEQRWGVNLGPKATCGEYWAMQIILKGMEGDLASISYGVDRVEGRPGQSAPDVVEVTTDEQRKIRDVIIEHVYTMGVERSKTFNMPIQAMNEALGDKAVEQLGLPTAKTLDAENKTPSEK